MRPSNFSWLEIDTETAARRLLGCELVSEVDNQIVRVRIVEVEAYDQNDEASDTFRGQSARNSSMLKPAGHLYVYFTYGMHHCINVVCGLEGHGSGVLIRAVEPLSGIDIIEQRRSVIGVNATNGPGKVAQALGIDRSLDGHYMNTLPVILEQKPPLATGNIISTRRIGI